MRPGLIDDTGFVWNGVFVRSSDRRSGLVSSSSPDVWPNDRGGRKAPADVFKRCLRIGCWRVADDSGDSKRRIRRRGVARTHQDTLSNIGVNVLIDQAFIDFVDDPPDPRELIGRENVIVVRSLTKFYAMPGLRIGYCLCQRELAIRLRRQMEAWPVSGPPLWAATTAVRDQEFERVSRSQNAEWRRDFTSALKQLGLTVYPSAASFFLVRLPRPAKELARWLGRHRILVRRCDSFRGLDDSFVRLAVKSPADNLRLVGLIKEWMTLGQEESKGRQWKPEN